MWVQEPCCGLGLKFEVPAVHLLHLVKQPLGMQQDDVECCMINIPRCPHSCCKGHASPAIILHLSMVSGQVSRRRLPSTQRAYREVWMNAW
jgi:hypothetical protein